MAERESESAKSTMKDSVKEMRLPIDENLHARMAFIRDVTGVMADTEIARLSIYKTFEALGGNPATLFSNAVRKEKKALELEEKMKVSQQRHARKG